jgi:hypothetical protein
MRAVDGAFEIAVTDNGPGIASVMAAGLFKPILEATPWIIAPVITAVSLMALREALDGPERDRLPRNRNMPNSVFAIAPGSLSVS